MSSPALVADLGNQRPNPDRALLESITRAQAELVRGASSRVAFEALLSDLLRLTASEYGFIGEVRRDEDGTPYLQTHAITNIAWNEATRTFHDENIANGLEFRNLDTLFGAVIRTGEAVISNAPGQDSRGSGIPEGHPPLEAFLGLPFHSRGEMVGMVGIANRGEGYDEELVAFLGPFLMTCSNLIVSLRSEIEHEVVARGLRESEARGRAILETAVDAIITIDTRGRIESCNRATTRLFGYEAQELVGENVSMLMPESHRVLHDSYISNYLETGRAKVIGIGREVPGRHKDGSEFWLELGINRIALDGRRMFVGTLRDITERRRSEDEMNRLNSELTRRVAELDALDRDKSVLAEFGSFLQAAQTEAEIHAAVRTFAGRLFPGQEGAFYALSEDGEAERVSAFGADAERHEFAFEKSECWALRRGESHICCTSRPTLECPHLEGSGVSSLCVPVMSQDGPVGLLVQLWDNASSSAAQCALESERRQHLLGAMAERLGGALSNVRLRMRLEDESIRDPLTRLYNRRYMSGYLQRVLRRARRHQAPVSLILVDIDHFKRLNDTHGHDAGDAVLRALARELAGGSRTDDAACRLGGEEFLLILPELDLAMAVERAEALRRRIAALRLPLGDGGEARVTVSLGVASAPKHGLLQEELLRHADQALYQAKDGGRNRVCVWRRDSIPPSA